jgi:hypothetical protein
MKDVVPWFGKQINRRIVLRSAMASVFGVAASTAVGQPAMSAVLVAPCTGPYGTGDCGDCSCRGSLCSQCGSVTCLSVPQFCGGSCWRSGSGTCCDCHCFQYSYSWYCYCYG